MPLLLSRINEIRDLTFDDSLMPFYPRQTKRLTEEGVAGRGLVCPHTHLVDDVDAILQLLPLQEGVKVF